MIKKISSKSIPTSNPKLKLSQSPSKENSNDANKSCRILRTKYPSSDSGKYSIKPEGLNLTVRVFCDMVSKNGVGVTEIGHDSESRTLVNGYNPPGSYKRKIKYNISMEQIVAIIKQSKNCEQFIKYECFGSMLLTDSDGWWVSRQGSNMTYWGGAAVDSGKCSCGMTNSCAGGKKCNCDMNDYAWREDSGYLTDKNTLPVTELRFGDTGILDGFNERGYHALGKLRCWG
ncbi:neurexin-4-like [Dendronephthya gigantea]|uniref:neurexin-4-like n=1 Tax=Dendronephthya gigantea TaxID=151771 RepID=UPI00106A60E4|nr:neurexin-4-like [Dendronephthya gigantea]XP_028418654.1 neurexin-4-like [Dendronephthya gigantea]